MDQNLDPMDTRSYNSEDEGDEGGVTAPVSLVRSRGSSSSSNNS